MIHENVDISGSLKVSGSFSLPRHASSANATATTGSMYHDTTDNVAKIYTGTEWVVVGEQSTPAASVDIEYLLVAGGGGGGARAGGGGGAGGYLSSSLSSVTSGSSFTVTVGSGGTAGTGGANGQNGGNGVDSSIAGDTISTITATGGGGGGGSDASGATPSGGSGGGASYSGELTGGSGTVGQGFDGGDSTGNSGAYPYKAGGGGGASEVGADGNVTAGTGGDGGDGKQSNITGTLTYYAGGGGGGTHNPAVNSGAGGQGGGGAAGASGGRNLGTAGTANTGGGGGGGSTNTSGDANSNGAAGGSGVAIFAYNSGSINCAGGIVGDAGNGRKYHQFNSSDTFKVGSTSDFQIVTDNLALSLDAGNFASRNSSSWTDISGNSNNITFSTTPSLGTNFYYYFGGSIRGYTSGAIINSSTFTLEAWVRTTTVSGWHTAVGTHGTYRQIGINGTTFKFGGNAGGGNLFIDGTTTASTNTWYHICMTVNGTSATGYVNGSQEVNGSIGSNGGTIGATVLSSYASNSNSETWTGDIAQVRVYNKQLSASEVLQNYNATKTNFV